MEGTNCYGCKVTLKQGEVCIATRGGSNPRSYHPSCATSRMQDRILAIDPTIQVAITKTEMEAIRRGLRGGEEEKEEAEEEEEEEDNDEEKEKEEEEEEEDNDEEEEKEGEAMLSTRKQPARKATFAEKAAGDPYEYEFESDGGSDGDDAAPPRAEKPAVQAELAKKAFNPFVCGAAFSDSDIDEEEVFNFPGKKPAKRTANVLESADFSDSDEEEVFYSAVKRPRKRIVNESDDDDDSSDDEDNAAPPRAEQPAVQAELARKAIDPFESDSDSDSDSDNDDDETARMLTSHNAFVLSGSMTSANLDDLIAIQNAALGLTSSDLSGEMTRIFAAHEAFAQSGLMTSANGGDLIAIQKAALGLT